MRVANALAASELARAVRALCDIDSGMDSLLQEISTVDMVADLLNSSGPEMDTLRGCAARILSGVCMADRGPTATPGLKLVLASLSGLMQKNKKLTSRFAVLVETLKHPTASDGTRHSAMCLCNALVNSTEDLRDRLSLRRELVRISIMDTFRLFAPVPLLTEQVRLFEEEHRLDIEDAIAEGVEQDLLFELGDCAHVSDLIAKNCAGTPMYYRSFPSPTEKEKKIKIKIHFHVTFFSHLHPHSAPLCT